MKKNALILLILLVNIACNFERLENSSDIKDHMDDYKVKRVTPTQIAYQVEAMGGEISKALTIDFAKQMANVSSARGEELCQLKNMTLIDSLSETYGLKIRLLGQPDIGSNKSLYAKEKEVLEAYAENASKKLEMGDNIQKIGDSLFVYTSPIPYDKGVGKLCFGDDSGFAIWSIILRKAEVVKSINVKKLKAKKIN
ncbi:hypothetical protein EMA8858_02988 [Emticicia aquatica]|jgi:hypothetical protein|uniref:Lipoprotein n=1 Tax=Emticicia aquatica TaxID=1681835 RepID=A0ABM9AT25_9BACT|nr:hypothetical protein [Emticicia aquatica]CAH0996853.1 hypothetical protein EMA8858_02988 [Emticicia aquatica]